MPKTWFRVHVSIVRNKKLQTLPPKLFKWAVNLWAICCEFDGVVPPIEEVAWTLHETEASTKKALDELQRLRFLDLIDGNLCIHDWSVNQFEAPSSSYNRVKEYRRKLAESGSSPGQFQKLRQPVLKRDGFKCVYCGDDENLVVDHVVPVAKGGWTDLDNLVAACRACNSGKSGRTPEEAGYRVIDPNAAVLVTLAVTKWRDSIQPVTVNDPRARASESESVSESGFVSSFPNAKIVENRRESDGWEEYLGVFLFAGKALNDADIQDALRNWLSLDVADRILAFQHIQSVARENEAQFVPMPANHLRRKPWTRRGPGRLLPEPRKQSRAEIGQAKAAAEFLAEGGD